MKPADRVGAVRQAQRKGRHVELALVAIDAAAQLEDLLDRDAAGVCPAVAIEKRTALSEAYEAIMKERSI